MHYSILLANLGFWFLMLIVGAFIVLELVKYGIKFAKKYIDEKIVKKPSILGFVTLLLISAFAYSIFFVGAWNLKQEMFNTITTYVNPNEKRNIEKSRKHIPASQKTLDDKKDELKDKTDKKVHKEAIESFDEKMKKETEKIKNRNK